MMKHHKPFIFFAMVIAVLAFSDCKKSSTPTAATASISALNCASSSFGAAATVNTAFSSTATVPYLGGNAIAYAAGTAISSTGVTGLTATLVAGTLANGAGNLTYTITGTPSTAGTADFAINFGGQNCNISLTVNPASSSNCSTATGVAKVICLCEAFKSTLSASQIATAFISYNFTNAKKWSNLPAAMSARNGIKLGSLNATQLAAAKSLIQEITGTTINEGYTEVQQVWDADDWLVSNGGANSDYGSGNYYLAILGTPALTGTFEILETGHHKTVANTYVNGQLVGATPEFSAVEPITWTNGTTYAPISQERDAFVTFLNSLTSTQLTAAKTSSTYTDLVLVPGKEWVFPTTFSGLQGNALTAAQKTNLINVIKTYTGDVDDANASAILATYTSELDNTYVLYSGTNTMTTKNDYFQISGPHVWIEFIIAGGIIYTNQNHIHSIWRDRINDYGGTKN